MKRPFGNIAMFPTAAFVLAAHAQNVHAEPVFAASLPQTQTPQVLVLQVGEDDAQNRSHPKPTPAGLALFGIGLACVSGRRRYKT